MPKHKEKRWIAKVNTDSTHPPTGLFKKDASTIAKSLASKRVSPKGTRVRHEDVEVLHQSCRERSECLSSCRISSSEQATLEKNSSQTETLNR